MFLEPKLNNKDLKYIAVFKSMSELTMPPICLPAKPALTFALIRLNASSQDAGVNVLCCITNGKFNRCRTNPS